jgi:hypothetical protein
LLARPVICASCTTTQRDEDEHAQDHVEYELDQDPPVPDQAVTGAEPQ